MVEFVSANPTGPMHMGNARGGVLGDTLANVLKRDGWDTWKEFYVNDAGNQVHKFAMSIYARCMQLTAGGGELPLPGGGLPWGRHPGAGPGLPGPGGRVSRPDLSRMRGRPLWRNMACPSTSPG